MGKIMKLGAVIFIITAVTGLILGGVYTMTLEPIRKSKNLEKNKALAETLPGAAKFENVEIAGEPGLIKEINRGTLDGELIGYNYTVTPKGYDGPLEIMAGVSKDGKLMAIKILQHTETPGLGAKAANEDFRAQFREKAVGRFTVIKTGASAADEIQALSGATITSKAVTDGVNAALSYFSEHHAAAAPQKSEAGRTGN